MDDMVEVSYTFSDAYASEIRELLSFQQVRGLSFNESVTSSWLTGKWSKFTISCPAPFAERLRQIIHEGGMQRQADDSW
jgi:hypothetical protein